jgi:limonene 1,2-monooxygenase
VGPERFDASWAVIEDAAAQAGRPADRYDAYVSVNVHLADTREGALENIRAGAARERYDFSSAVTGSPLPSVPRERWAEALADRPTDIIGTPDDAAAKLRPLLERTGAGGVLIWSKEWASREATWRSYERFARYVMPEFQGSLQGLGEAQRVARGLVVPT